MFLPFRIEDRWNFSMLVDNRLTSPVRNGTVLGVGMTLYTYANTTQMANTSIAHRIENPPRRTSERFVEF